MRRALRLLVLAILATQAWAANQPPVLDPVAPRNLAEDFAPVVVTLTGIGDGDGGGQGLTVTATSSDPAVLPHPFVAYASPAATASLLLYAAADANGSATVTVTVRDDAGGTDTTTVSFAVTISPRNDAPVFVCDASVTMQEFETGTVGISGLYAGPANESSQTVSLNVTVLDPEVLEVTTIQPVDGDPSRFWVYLRPITNAIVTHTTVVITAIDDGPQGAGDIAVSSRTVDCTVLSLDAAPVIYANQTLEVGTGGAVTITSNELEIVDPDHGTITYEVLVLPEHGTLRYTSNGAVLDVGSTFSQQQMAFDNGIFYQHDGSLGTGDAFSVMFSDPNGSYGPLTIPVAVAGITRPSIALFATWVFVTEAMGPFRLVGAAELLGCAPLIQPGGSLLVRTSLPFTGDSLSIMSTGTDPGQISVSGETILYGGSPIATFHGGQDGASLVVSFAGADATAAAAQAVVRNVGFLTTTDDPFSSLRYVEFILDDGVGEASLPVAVNVLKSEANDPPAIPETRISVPAGITSEIVITASDPDSRNLTWSLTTAPTQATVVLVDAATGRFRITSPAGADIFGIRVSDGYLSANATIQLTASGGDDPRPHPSTDAPREAFAGSLLACDVTFDTTDFAGGAALDFRLSSDAPPAATITATGDASAHLEWLVPATEPAQVHRRFLVIASDRAGRGAGVLPLSILVRAAPGGGG